MKPPCSFHKLSLRVFLPLVAVGAMVGAAISQPAGSPTTWSTFFVFFRLEKDEVADRFKEDVRQAVCQAKLGPEAQLVIHGFADGRGSRLENQSLSEHRALAVVDLMARYGMSCARPTEIKGRGEQGNDGDDQPFFRRVDILIKAPLLTGTTVQQCLNELTLGAPQPSCKLSPNR